eukprot:TRINITY_DN3526_c0_g1_i2.p4 TRINITY_DN3526_c0_g1~~TRINITY_DN3526_c0_g1_i2.p4  ORF type:complete len:121 (-),score=19.97 TRINITY_DN3526_c0_g1_i2:9-371(-)
MAAASKAQRSTDQQREILVNAERDRRRVQRNATHTLRTERAHVRFAGMVASSCPRCSPCVAITPRSTRGVPQRFAQLLLLLGRHARPFRNVCLREIFWLTNLTSLWLHNNQLASGCWTSP